MRLSDLLQTNAISTPWPVVLDGHIYGGQRMARSPVCIKKCGNAPECADLGINGSEHVCRHGLSYFPIFGLGEGRATIFGVRGPGNSNASSPVLKHALKGRSVTDAEVNEWRTSVETLIRAVDSEFLRRQSEMLDPLHDPIRLARQIRNIAYSLVGAPYDDVDEALEKSGPAMKSLVKASELLSDSFDFLTLYFNPAAASFGRKVYLSLHGLLLKLTRILEITDVNNQQEEVRIFLNGQCHKQVLVYESFKLVPFALISNAVKYRLIGPVRVFIFEHARTVEVSVESQGPAIEPDELDSIFLKRKRGKWGEKVASGTGVGLYLAKIAADANDFAIRVYSVKQAGRTERGVPVANNKFTFELPFAA